jgi:hypothetical protein
LSGEMPRRSERLTPTDCFWGIFLPKLELVSIIPHFVPFSGTARVYPREPGIVDSGCFAYPFGADWQLIFEDQAFILFSVQIQIKVLLPIHSV